MRLIVEVSRPSACGAYGCRMWRIGILALLGVLAVLLAPTAQADELLVAFRPGVAKVERIDARRDAGVQVQRVLGGNSRYQLVEAPNESAAERLADDPRVLIAVPDERLMLAAADPLLGSLWNLTMIGSSTADSSFTGRVGAAVAVVDTGVATHEDIGPLYTNPGESGLDATGAAKATNGIDDDHNGYVDDLHGWDFTKQSCFVSICTGGSAMKDINGHGTHVSGTIAATANNGLGIRGVTPTAAIVPLRVFGDDNGSASVSDVAEAFMYAGDNDIAVVNASLGGSGSSSLTTYFDSIYALYPNTLFVVAAGNSGSNNDTSPFFPCTSSALNQLCVAATTQSDTLASYSNYGTTNVDLAAPGSSIWSTIPTNSYGLKSGTSMATPHVAATAAMLAAMAPNGGAASWRSTLLSTVTARSSLAGKMASGGRLNAGAAVTAALATAKPAVTSAPSISGTARDGALLTAVNGTWSGQGPMTPSYKWLRCVDEAATVCSALGVTTGAYTLQSTDVGRTIVVEVTMQGPTYQATARSAATEPVAVASAPDPAPTPDPTPVPDPTPDPVPDPTGDPTPQPEPEPDLTPDPTPPASPVPTPALPTPAEPVIAPDLPLPAPAPRLRTLYRAGALQTQVPDGFMGTIRQTVVAGPFSARPRVICRVAAQITGPVSSALRCRLPGRASAAARIVRVRVTTVLVPRAGAQTRISQIVAIRR